LVKKGSGGLITTAVETAKRIESLQAGQFGVELRAPEEPAKTVKFSSIDVKAHRAALEAVLSRAKYKFILFQIDDVDEVFYFRDRQFFGMFLKGLYEAALDINEILGASGMILVLVREGAHKIFAEEFKGPTDAIRESTFPIEWGKDDLTLVLTKRLAERKQQSPEGSETPVGEMEWCFGSLTQQGKILELILDNVVTGPRDVIDLVNRVAKKERRLPLSYRGFQECLTEYSEEKLREYETEFGHIIPQGREFLLAFVARLSKEDLRSLGRDRFGEIVDAVVTRDVGKKLQYFHERSKDAILEDLKFSGVLTEASGGRMKIKPGFVHRAKTGRR
jgi:hypothetical protein